MKVIIWKSFMTSLKYDKEVQEMKRATAIVTYREDFDKDSIRYYQIFNVSVVTRDNHLVQLREHNLLESPNKAYKYYSWHTLYEDILGVIRMNGFYLSSYEQFGRRWYDIQFINIAKPWEINRYSHSWH